MSWACGRSPALPPKPSQMVGKGGLNRSALAPHIQAATPGATCAPPRARGAPGTFGTVAYI